MRTRLVISGRRKRRSQEPLTWVLTALAMLVAAPVPAHAAFPGQDGHIAIGIATAPASEIPELLRTVGVVDDKDLYSIPPTGSGLRRLTSGVDIDGEPAWSPDGRSVLFTRSDPTFGRTYGADIYMVDARGGEPRNLTSTPQFLEYDAAWSPDGARIAFMSDRAGPDIAWRVGAQRATAVDLYVMDADGNNVERLTSDPGMESRPEWSPDGGSIVYVDDGIIKLMRLEGAAPRPLGRGESPHWAPDGRSIIYNSPSCVGTAGCPPGRADILVLDLRSGKRHNLTSGSDAEDMNAVWAPSGRRIAFVSNRDGAWRLYTMSADGSDARLVVDLDLKTPYSQLDWGPRP